DGTGKPTVVAGGDDIASQQPRYSSRGELAWLSDESGWMNLSVGPADEHEHGSPSWGPGQRSYTWSPDGAKIAFNRNEGGFGRLYSPPGVERPPLICFLHGGPTGQTSVTSSHRIAWYVANGWAVLVPDYRGSTGWGRAYAQSLHGRWGDLDVEDSAAGMKAAAA